MPIIRRSNRNGHAAAATLPAAPVYATSYTMTESGTTGATGSPVTLTFAPVGGAWPVASIGIAVSGVSDTLANGSGGTLSGTTLTVPSGTSTSGTVTMTPSTAGTATITPTNNAGMTNPGNLTYTVTSGGSAGTVPNFTLAEWSGASSAPYARVGMAFAKGDVPSGYTPVIGSVAAQQFDARTTWSDGSLKFAVAHIRDASNFTASQSRSYSVTPTAGSFSNTGSLTLASVLSGHDFKVNFSSVVNYNMDEAVTRGTGSTDTLSQAPISGAARILHYTQGVDYTISGSTITWSGGSSPPAFSTYYVVYLAGAFSNTTHGSGSFTSSLTTAIATATRITKVHSGPVCEGWVVWNMARDNTGNAEDAHLKTYWHIDAWKDGSGAVYALEVAAVVALDWWSVANKMRLDYNATLADGSTTLNTYSGVQHPYGSWWITCRTTSDNNIGRRPWVGGSIPTLVYKPDRAYLIKTGLIPPLDLTVTPTPISGSLLTYTPCQAGPTGIDGNEQGVYHRVSIDGTGAYLGRGNMPRQDTNAIMLQTPLDMANARIGALAGLSIPSHRRSNRTRTRPGEGTADTASTIIAQRLDNPNKTTGWDDCTADGMPVPVYAYAGDGRNASTWTDSYVRSTGGELCDPYVPAGVWQTTTSDASHGAAYSYGMYALEGENYFLEATLDHACWCVYQCLAAGYGVRGLLLDGDSAYSSLSIPSVQYSALGGIWKPSNQRSVGWAINLLGIASGIIPVDHVAYNYMQKWRSSVGDWIGSSLQYMPASQKAIGAFYPNAGFDGVPGQGDVPPWFPGIIALGSYMAYRLTEDTRYRDLGDCAAGLPIGIYASGRNYIADQYHIADRPRATDWSTSNEFYAPGNVPAHNFGGSVTDHASGLLSFDIGEGGGQNQSGGSVTMQTGDQWSPSSSTANAHNLAIPPEITEGTIYYVRDVTVSTVFGMPNSATFRITTTPGGTGSAITFASNVTNFGMQWWPQDAVHSVCSNPPYIEPADSYGPLNAAAVEMAKACGNTAATSTIVNSMRTFIAPIPRGGWTPWALKAT